MQDMLQTVFFMANEFVNSKELLESLLFLIKKSNILRVSCKTDIIQLPIYIQSQFTDMNSLSFYKFKRISGKPNFSDQLKKKRYKRVGYNMDIMRQSAYLIVNPIMVYSYDVFFNCMNVGQASDSMMALM